MFMLMFFATPQFYTQRNICFKECVLQSYSAMRVPEKSLICLPATQFPEQVFPVMAIQATVGICDAIQLLGSGVSDKQLLLGLISKINARIPGALCESVSSLVQETTKGAYTRQSDFQNTSKAIIGMTRAVQLLDDSLSWETKFKVFNLCGTLVKLGKDHEAHIGQSAVGLMDEVFKEMIDPEDDQEYLAQEPELQAAHGLPGCGCEYWNPEWDR